MYEDSTDVGSGEEYRRDGSLTYDQPGIPVKTYLQQKCQFIIQTSVKSSFDIFIFLWALQVQRTNEKKKKFITREESKDIGETGHIQKQY